MFKNNISKILDAIHIAKLDQVNLDKYNYIELFRMARKVDWRKLLKKIRHEIYTSTEINNSIEYIILGVWIIISSIFVIHSLIAYTVCCCLAIGAIQ
jgi:hypothetical protein